jgi:Cdc25 family phosphatase
MSSISIATLQRMSRDTLAALVSASTPSSKLAIIDVRDSGEYKTISKALINPINHQPFSPDHVGGHIHSSTWVPSSSLDVRMPELVRTLKDTEKVVFHCALSQQRGPSAALRYARERQQTYGPEESQKQEVYVLDGGFVKWQEKYGRDKNLTEAYAADIWRED